MQHQPRLAAQQPRRVDAQRQILADALGGVLGDRGLGVAVGPQVLHSIASLRVRDDDLAEMLSGS